MRSVIYGTFLTVVLAVAGGVQANELDGKSLLCKYTKTPTSHAPYVGFVFDRGKVTKWIVRGHTKTKEYPKPIEYHLKGTSMVWWTGAEKRTQLYRDSLNVWEHLTRRENIYRCEISSKKEIFQKLDEIIVKVKKKNKI